MKEFFEKFWNWIVSAMKAVWNWIVSIPKDKLLHDYAALLIAMFSYAILFRFGVPKWWRFGFSNAIALAVLIYKEIRDSKHEGHSVEIMDIVWGCFGILKWDAAALIMFL
jgi:hypothetical protein